MKHKHMVTVLMIISLLLNNCSTTEEVSNVTDCDPVEDFELFYEAFHSDSVFQYSRILFPLKGYLRTGTEDPELAKGDFVWTQDKWIMNHIIDLENTDFKQDMIVTDTLVIDKIYLKDSGFRIKRQFRTINCKWYLYHYSEVDL